MAQRLPPGGLIVGRANLPIEGHFHFRAAILEAPSGTGGVSSNERERQ
jgi:hypothetical protein